jgi:hypothetical protein
MKISLSSSDACHYSLAVFDMIKWLSFDRRELLDLTETGLAPVICA